MGLSGLTGLSGESGLITAKGWSPSLDNLIAWWTLDEESGNRADSHTNALTLTDTNTVLYTAGVVGNAALFVKANNEALKHADDALLRTGDIDFTLGGWFKLTSSGIEQFLLAKWQSAVGMREYTLGIQNTNIPKFYVSADGTATVSVVASTFGAVGTATWYFFVVSHDAALNKIHIEINNATKDSADHATGVNVNTASFALGQLGDTININMNGALDETFFYKRLLTDEEKTWFYNGGAGRTYADLL